MQAFAGKKPKWNALLNKTWKCTKAFAFALEVVLPGNRKMYPYVTTGWRLLQTPKRYNRNICNSSLCLAVRSTRESCCMCDKFINLARLGITTLFFTVYHLLSCANTDHFWLKTLFFFFYREEWKDENNVSKNIQFWTNVYFMVTSNNISFLTKLQKIMDIHFKYNYF